MDSTETLEACTLTEELSTLHLLYMLYKHKIVAIGWLDLVILSLMVKLNFTWLLKAIVELHIIIAGLPGLVLISISLFCSHNSCCKCSAIIHN